MTFYRALKQRGREKTTCALRLQDLDKDDSSRVNCELEMSKLIWDNTIGRSYAELAQADASKARSATASSDRDHDASSKKHERTKDNWPTSNYIPPSESFKTSHSVQFPAKTISESERSRPIIKDGPSSIILKDVEPAYDTAYRSQFSVSSKSSSPSKSHSITTQKVPYNIINGAPVSDSRWRYESCLSTQDKRRTRGVQIE